MPRIALTALLLITLAVSGLTGCSHMPRELPLLSGSSKEAKTQFAVARLQERSGKLGKALELYRGLQSQQPNDPIVNHRLGIVYSRLGDHVEAEKHFLAAIEKSPGDQNILTDFGYSLYLRDELDRAETILRQAVVIDTRNPRAVNNLAIVCGHQGNTKESYRLFRQVGSEAKANANLAFILVQRGEGEKAMKHYSRALTLDDSLESASNALIELAQSQRRAAANNATESAPAESKIAASKVPVDSTPSFRIVRNDSPIQIESVNERSQPLPQLPTNVVTTTTSTIDRQFVPADRQQRPEESPQRIEFGDRRINGFRPRTRSVTAQSPAKQSVATHRPLLSRTLPSRELPPITRTPIATQRPLDVVEETASTRVVDVAQPFTYDFPVTRPLN